MIPINYCSARGNSSSRARRHIEVGGKLINKFTPTTSGWYRIMINSNNYYLAGDATITCSHIFTNDDNTYASFNYYADLYTGFLKINSAAKNKNRISAIRMGRLSSDGTRVIDIAVTGNFSVSDNPRDSYLEIAVEPRRGEGHIFGYASHIDPYLLEAESFVYQSVKNITTSWVSDLIDYIPVSNQIVIPGGVSISGLRISGDAPSAYTTAGISGQMATSRDFLYIHTGNGWGKVQLIPV
jgi:hypothetical protein